MHRHHRWYLIAALSAATALTALAASTASAQRLQTTPTTSPTIVVDIGGTFTWIAKEIQWPGGAPTRTAPRMTERTTSAVAPRMNARTSFTTVELRAPTTSADAAFAQWRTGTAAQPKDVTLTLMNASGAPALKYVLHNAIPTKVTIGQLDAGSSKVSVTHVTLTAEGVTVVPVGQ